MVWSMVLFAVLLLGMLFYPVINADGLLSQLDGMFQNPMMKGVMGAFGVEASALGSLMGFFVTYNSMYNILLGCIFASLLAGNLLAKEEADKTAEFLLTRPVSRTSVYTSKAAVLLTYSLLLSMVLWLSSVCSLELVKGNAPRILDLRPSEKTILLEQIEAHPGLVYEAFDLDTESFTELAMAYAASLLQTESRELQTLDFDPTLLNKMIESVSQDTEAFFMDVLSEPDIYMDMFHFPKEQQEEFLEKVREEQSEYYSMRKEFFESPDLLIMFLDKNPESLLSRYSEEEGSMNKAVSILELPVNFEARIFSKYSLRKLSALIFYIFLLISSLGLLNLMLSIIVKRGKSMQGLALGLVLFLFFWDSLTSMAGQFISAVAWLGKISPFHWLDDDILRKDYGLQSWRVIAFCLLSGVAFFSGCKIFNRKDILI